MKKENTQLERRLPAGITFSNKNDYSRETNSFMYSYYGIDHEDEDGINLRELLQIIRRRIGLVLLITIIVTAPVALIAMSMNPWYSSSAVIEIAKRNSMILINDRPEDLDQYFVMVSTNKLVLESLELFEEVARNLKLIQNEVLVKKALKGGISLGSQSSSNLVDKVVRGDLTSDEQKFVYKKIAKYLKENIKTVQVANARALQVSFTYEEPVLTARITNTIADVFVQRRFIQQTERLRSSADWLKNSTMELKKRGSRSREEISGVHA